MTLPGILPYPLGFGGADGSGTYTPGEVAYNYAIGGLPFLSAADRNHPYVRSTAPFRKQQFDNSNEPGEQSLDGWWLRSQQSFHGGAGQLYNDPLTSQDEFTSIRFWQSKGVSPWTQGELSLLPAVDQLGSESYLSMASNGVGAIAFITGNDIMTVSAAGVKTQDTGAIGPGLGVSVAIGSTYYYHGTTTQIDRKLITSGASVAWTGWYTAGWAGSELNTTVMAWVKERLVVATELGVYELTGSGAPTVPTANWLATGGSWTPKGIAESNSAIYVAGVTAGNRSIILKFTLDNTGAMPVLASGVIVAELPFGETITSISSYLGRFLAISTDMGPRIATIDSSGDLEVGPILFEGATQNWVARGEFLYTPAVLPEWDSGEGGLARIDLGLELSSLRFPYASDVSSTALGGAATCVGIVTAGILFGGPTGLFIESPTEFVDEGWLQSSRIRYGTLEPKTFKLLRVRGPVLTSDFFVSVVDPDGAEHDVVGYVSGQTPGDEDSAIPDLGPLDYLSVKITLDSTSDHLTSPTTGGWQVKAIPGQVRQRMLQIPLQCFDSESDRNGVEIGGLGTAAGRLLALEAVDEAANTVVLQDFDFGTADLVAIDSVQFEQVTRPNGTTTDPNVGGIITLTVRTV